MGLEGLVNAFVNNWNSVKVMSPRYVEGVIEALDPDCDKTAYSDLIGAFEEEGQVHLVPSFIRDRMGPTVRLSYESCREAAQVVAFEGYLLGRVAREKLTGDLESFFENGYHDPDRGHPFDAKVHDVSFLGYFAHAATEYFFHSKNQPLAVVAKGVGYVVGLATLPLAILGGLSVDPVDYDVMNSGS